MTYVSTAAAARILGVTPRRVQALASQRRIPGARLAGRDWRIPVTDGAVAVTPGTRGPKSAGERDRTVGRTTGALSC